MSEPPVASVLPEMTKDQRREAIAALRDPAAVVEVPASWELCHGDAVHRDHQYYMVRGTIEFNGRAYRVHAVRKPPEYRGSFAAPRRSPLDTPMTYSGDVDPARKVVRGTVDFDVRSYNRPFLLLSPVLIAGIAILARLDERSWPVSVLAGLVLAAVMIPLAWITPRRRAKWMLPDLQRVAALAAGVEVKARYPAQVRRPREL